MSPMPLGIFARTFAGRSAHVVLAQARAAGYATVQYNMACSGLPSLPSEVGPEVVAELRAASRATGVRLAALSATFNMVHPDVAVRRAGLATLSVLAAAARDSGIPILTLCTGSRNAADQWAPHPENAHPDAWRDLLETMESALAIADAHDVLLGVEPEPANVVSSAARARSLIDELRSARVGVVLDGANLLDAVVLRGPPDAARDVIARALELLADRIVLVHAKDRSASGAVVPPGRGAMDYAMYLGALASAGVDAPLIAHGLDAGAAPAVARFLRTALA